MKVGFLLLISFRASSVAAFVRAPWCRACKGLEPKYKQVANKYPKAISFKQLNWEVTFISLMKRYHSHRLSEDANV